jgi:hypothetical protein
MRWLGRGLRTSMRHNGQAYGFSVSITAGFAIMAAEQGSPAASSIALFALGAVAAFSLMQGVASVGFRRPLESEPTTVTSLAVSLSFLSVGSAVGVAWVVAVLADGTPAWPLGGFALSTAYGVSAGLELVIAELVQNRSHGGRPETEDEPRTEAQETSAPRTCGPAR